MESRLEMGKIPIFQPVFLSFSPWHTNGERLRFWIISGGPQLRPAFCQAVCPCPVNTFLLPVSGKLQFSDNAAGIANGDTPGGNILCDNAPCPNDAALSNGYPRQN